MGTKGSFEEQTCAEVERIMGKKGAEAGSGRLAAVEGEDMRPSPLEFRSM
jgi:hypothetical protein